MLSMKFKEEAKFKSYGKCDLLHKPQCAEDMNLMKNKVDYRDYVNEIFAGLIWLG